MYWELTYFDNTDGKVFASICKYVSSNSEPYCDREDTKTWIQSSDRRDTSFCVETKDFAYIPFFN
jgi:hypothetical protein